MNEKQMNLGLSMLEIEFGKDKIQQIIGAIKKFQVEIPSWIFGPFGGGRFGDYMPPGAARTSTEKLQDASLVNQLTGATRDIAVHVLWDFSEDTVHWNKKIAQDIIQKAEELQLKIGSISPTYFLEGSYRGSLCADEEDTRQRYIDQTLFAGEVAALCGSNLITIWLPDGSLYPGQADLRRAHQNTRESLIRIREALEDKIHMLIEYKVFEPGTYSTVLSDWGSAYLMAKGLGKNAGVLVDLGHHFHGVNIEQIVARLISEEMRCGFHFNTRYAADDDHSVEPNAEMARIFYELTLGDVIFNADPNKNWAFMIDQASSRENRIQAILHSVDSLQHMLARSMLVDPGQLRAHQDADEIILANRYFNDAIFYADVRPLVAKARLDKNLPIDPVQAFVDSGYQQKIEMARQ